MIRVYSDTEGVPASILCGIFSCNTEYEWVSSPEAADFFAFPTHYQVAYDYTDYEYGTHGLTPSVKSLLLEKFEEIKRLSATHGRPIICFYLRDDTTPLPIENAIIFRSSLLRSKRGKNEFAYPANGRPLLVDTTKNYEEWLPWTSIPTVGFVGQSIALNLPVKTAIKNHLNRLSVAAGFNSPFKLKYNFGYQQRRNAIIALKDSDKIQFDFRITSNQDYFNDDSRFFYSDNLLTHQYALAASGHGNYSYRFYEIMEAGRIPLFIDTDCVLPFEELIDYRNMMVWVEASQTEKTLQKLLLFHLENEGQAFIKKQEFIKNTWQAYLKGDNFYRQIPFYLRQF